MAFAAALRAWRLRLACYLMIQCISGLSTEMVTKCPVLFYHESEHLLSIVNASIVIGDRKLSAFDGYLRKMIHKAVCC